MKKSEDGAPNSPSSSKDNEKVPFLKLFSFADGMDIALMIIGTLGGIGNGLAQPIMTVILGQLINTFGTNIYDKSEILHQVGQVRNFKSLLLAFLNFYRKIFVFVMNSIFV